jgi:hypothetical protein
VDELHEYAKEKVQEESPAMTPQFLPVEQGYRIILACSPQDDPKLNYRKEVELMIQESEGEIDFIQGEFDELDRDYLEINRRELNLSVEEAKAIETEVMGPHRQRWKKLQEYEILFSKAVKRRFPLTESDLRKLQRIQNRLSLRDEDIRQIEAKITQEEQLKAKIIQIKAESTPNLPQTQIESTPTKSKLEPDIELKSEVGVDYSKLKELLSQEKWKEADEETTRVMLKAANQEEQGWLEPDDIKNFPCADLRSIDQLWLEYSNGRFGFSVQKKIYLECGAKPDDKIWYKFCEQVGWRGGVVRDALNFIKTPQGHLPKKIFQKNIFFGGIHVFEWWREEVWMFLLSHKDL